MKLSNQNHRRHFLRELSGAIVLASAANPALSLGRVASAFPEQDKKLRFYNTHTSEELHIIYWSAGQYIEKSLQQLNYLLRDHRQHEAVVMDPALFDQLWKIQQIVGGTEVYEVISGYRSKKTNALLRERSSKVSSNSFHIQGRAVDIRLRGTHTLKLRAAATQLKAGGVGYYTTSDFIHIDTGPVRQWG